MRNYGTALTWGTVSAPHPFNGICKDYSYRSSYQKQFVDDDASDIAAMILHGEKGDISFNSEITSASTDFFDISAGAKIAISGLAGVVLLRRLVEKWTIGQTKTGALEANHYPDMVDADGDEPGELSAVTPTQTGLIVRPADKVVWSTAGLTHTAGIVHGLTLTQELKFDETVNELGKIIAAIAFGYLRTIELDVLATGAAPAKNTVLTVTGAPEHASGYVITDADIMLRQGDKKMYRVAATWFDGIGTGA
jgi:hypothetical protein